MLSFSLSPCTLESATCPLRGSDVTTPPPLREGLPSPLGSPRTAHRPSQRHLLLRGPARRQRQQPPGPPPAPGHPLPPAHPGHHRRDDGQQRPRHQAFRGPVVRGARREGKRQTVSQGARISILLSPTSLPDCFI